MQTLKTVLKKFNTGNAVLNLKLESVYQSAIHASTYAAELKVADELKAIQAFAYPFDAAYVLCEALDQWYEWMYRNAQQHPFDPDTDGEILDCITGVIRIRFWIDNGMVPYDELLPFLSEDDILLKLNAFVIPGLAFHPNQSICGVYDLPQELNHSQFDGIDLTVL